MRNIFRYGVPALIAAALLSACPSAFALRIVVQSKDTTAEALEADAIVIGKVTNLEKELVAASQNAFANAPKVDYQVGMIEISESVLGAKGLTSVRVGWQPTAAALPGTDVHPNLQPAIRPAIVRPMPGRGAQIISLSEGQEGCFFLKKHHEADFFVLVPNGKPIDKKAENFEQEVQLVKKIVKIVENPIPALKVKEAEDRHLAALLLVRKYRTFLAGANGMPAQQEEIPADESKLILRIASEMEWNQTGGAFDPKKVYASNLFYLFNIPQGQEGYTPPKFEQGQDYNKILGDYTLRWFKDNAEKYRIKKFVAEKK